MMKYLLSRFFPIAILALLSWANPLFSQDLVVTGSETISGTATYDNVTVQAGGVLTVDGVLNVNQDMLVENGGVVTHSLRFFDGLRLNVAGALEVQVGGRIDANAKGLKGGRNGGSSYGCAGESYNANGELALGANNYAGASYGGWGATSTANGSVTNAPYGLIEDPSLLGSGGGTRCGYTPSGGHGGGLILINSGSLILEGDISANGGNGTSAYLNNNGGGGSGGSIKIISSTISGSGKIYSNGGTGPVSTAGGGGGRIAVFYDEMDFPPENIYARGGALASSDIASRGGAGTIYLKKTSESGRVFIENGGSSHLKMTPFSSHLTAIQSLRVANNASFLLASGNTSALTIEDSLLIQNNSSIEINNAFAVSIPNTDGFDVRCYSGGKLSIDSTAILNADAIQIAGGILETRIDLSFPNGNDFVLSNGGQVLVRGTTVFSLAHFGPSNIQSGLFSFSKNCQLNIASNQIIVESGVTLEKDGTFGESDEVDNITIEQGGIISHSTRVLAGLNLKVAGVLDIKAGGAIDVTGRGLLGGQAATNYYGEAYNQAGEVVAIVGKCISQPGYYGPAGGSYGGYANSKNLSFVPSNPPYDVIENPEHLGAGGGGAGNCVGLYYNGGNGGGLIKIQTPQLILDGAIKANGWPTTASNVYGGGGAGGGIRIDAGSISGSGSIQANGGEGKLTFDASGAGSGGRIALYYETNTFPEGNIQAHGGVKSFASAAGTIFLKSAADQNGSLIIENNNIDSPLSTPILSENPSPIFKEIKLLKRAKLYLLDSEVTTIQVQDSVYVSGNSILEVGENVTMSILNNTGFDINIAGGTIVLDTGSILTADKFYLQQGTLTTNIDLSFPNSTDFQFTSGSVLNVQNNTTFTIGSFDNTNIKGGTFNLKEGSILDIQSNSINVASGVMLNKDGTFGSTDEIGSVTVASGGVISHSTRFLSGLNLNVTGALDVQAGGAIDVTGRGLLGGQGVTNYYGEAYNQAGEVEAIVGKCISQPGYYGPAGGSYGGYANSKDLSYVPSNPPYGVIENPEHLGAGGGGAGNCGGLYYNGGNGGGLIKIQTPQLILNGAIKANGWPTTSGDYGGGGAGGGIRIDADNISGNGSIQANGGEGKLSYDASGAGSGGRIALYYGTNTFPEGNIQAHGGIKYFPSAAGTIFLKLNTDQKGDIIIDNNNVQSNLSTPLLTNEDEFKLRVRNRGTVEIDYEHVFQEPGDFEVTQNGNVYLVGTAILTVPSMQLPVTGTVSICPTCTFNIISGELTIGNGGTLIKDGRFGNDDSLNNLTISSGGVITHSDRYFEGLKLKITGNLNIEPGGLIDVNSRGLKGGRNGSIFNYYGETYAENLDTIVAGAQGLNFGTGGSYGGLGEIISNNAQPNPIYGDANYPDLLGSGGGGGTSFSSEKAGNGGGKVLIYANNLMVNGTIRSNGGNGESHVGGGSGGSILIFSESIDGNGSIQARGGNGGCVGCTGGAAGGGRVAIYATNPIFPTANISVAPGIGDTGMPEEGTIVYKNCDFASNIGLDTVLVPQAGAVYPIDTAIAPQIVVRNYSPNSKVTQTRLKIGNFYVDETFVNLAPGEIDTITFYPWIIKQTGTLTATAEVVNVQSNCDADSIQTVIFGIDAGGSPVITSRSPSVGGNTGNVTMVILGENFLEGAQVWLYKSGGSILSSIYTEYKSKTKLFATFNLVSADTGFYNLVVRNPDMQEGEFPDALRVTQGALGWEGEVNESCVQSDFNAGDLLDIQVIHGQQIRLGRQFQVTIKYKNVGNIDIPVLTKRFRTDNRAPIVQDNSPCCLPITRWVLCGFVDCAKYCEDSIFFHCYLKFGPCDRLVATWHYMADYTVEWVQVECDNKTAVEEITLRFDEPGGPQNVLRPGAGGTKTIWVYPDPDLYQGLSKVKFQLVD